MRACDSLVCTPYRSLHVLLLVLLLCLVSCTSGGDQGQATAPSAPSPQVERQAIDNLLALYQEAVVAEDSDRLQALLAPATALAQAQITTAPRQDPPAVVTDPTAFQAALQATFQQATVTALAIPPETVVLAPDQSSCLARQRWTPAHLASFAPRWGAPVLPSGPSPGAAVAVPRRRVMAPRDQSNCALPPHA